MSAATPIIAKHPMKTLREQMRCIKRWLGRYGWLRACKEFKEDLVFWRTLRKAPILLRDLEDLDVLVVSHGGVGTNVLKRFLFRKHYAVNNAARSQKLTHRVRLFHIARPFSSLDRCSRIIYIFGDPVSAVVSLFRRQFAHHHYLTLQANFKLFPPFLLTKKLRGLREYVEKGKNKFPFEQHFDFWFNARLRQPILFIRYETLWDNLDVLFDFLDMPADMRSDFPKYCCRESDVDALPPDVKAGLDRMYGEFSKKLESLPDHILHMPPHTRSSGNAP